MSTRENVRLIARAPSQPRLCMWSVKALAIFRGCAGSSEPSLLAYAIGTIIS